MNKTDSWLSAWSDSAMNSRMGEVMGGNGIWIWLVIGLVVLGVPLLVGLLRRARKRTRDRALAVKMSLIDARK